MNTFTLRQIPLPVERRLRKLAHDSSKSLNKTAVEILANAVGLGEERKKSPKHRDVKSALRRWSLAEYQEFERTTKAFDSIDKEIWRA